MMLGCSDCSFWKFIEFVPKFLVLFAAIFWTVGAWVCKLVFQVSIYLTIILLCITGKKSACWNYKQKFTDYFGVTIDSTPSKNIAVVCHGFVLFNSEGQKTWLFVLVEW